MEADRLQKPLRNLRKGLKSLPRDPAPGRVHDLRTRARQMETFASALMPPNGRKTRQLLKTIKPLRKAAGSVRDVDVMTEIALKLTEPSGRDSLARLVKYLGSTREKNAVELLDAVERRRKAARRRLKQFAKRMESAQDSRHRAVEIDGGVHTAAHKLRSELSKWPELNADNIHRFRIKIKELRSLLQLERDSDAGLVRSLTNAKNKIGNWHDWQQLREIAGAVLDAGQDRTLLLEIDGAVERKLERALAVANALRRRYLRPIIVLKKAS
jgi:CHAD domain-containing protein